MKLKLKSYLFRHARTLKSASCMLFEGQIGAVEGDAPFEIQRRLK